VTEKKRPGPGDTRQAQADAPFVRVAPDRRPDPLAGQATVVAEKLVQAHPVPEAADSDFSR
jgi:hypothetical protein